MRVRVYKFPVKKQKGETIKPTPEQIAEAVPILRQSENDCRYYAALTDASQWSKDYALKTAEALSVVVAYLEADIKDVISVIAPLTAPARPPPAP